MDVMIPSVMQVASTSRKPVLGALLEFMGVMTPSGKQASSTSRD
jgi:hypothetical protein